MESNKLKEVLNLKITPDENGMIYFDDVINALSKTKKIYNEIIRHYITSLNERTNDINNWTCKEEYKINTILCNAEYASKHANTYKTKIDEINNIIYNVLGYSKEEELNVIPTLSDIIDTLEKNYDKMVMVEYAKMHVKKALKAVASLKYYDEYKNIRPLSEDDIMNAYDLNNIKI